MKRLWRVVGIGLVVGASACGGDDNGEATDSSVSDSSSTLTIHSCSTFEDRRASSADRTVQFGVNGALAYAPNCMRIARGQSVTFSGIFVGHPLRPGRAPSRATDPEGSAGNPITATDSGMSAAFKFPSAGTYPYYCNYHQGSGMYGVIDVK